MQHLLIFSIEVPDFAIVTILENLGIKFTTEFYRLLRGFLEMNLGESLVPVPETIPIEVLQRPYEACVSFLFFISNFACKEAEAKNVVFW